MVVMVVLVYHMRQWVAYKKEIAADTTDSSTSDCETSDEAADK